MKLTRGGQERVSQVADLGFKLCQKWPQKTLFLASVGGVLRGADTPPLRAVGLRINGLRPGRGGADTPPPLLFPCDGEAKPCQPPPPWQQKHAP